MLSNVKSRFWNWLRGREVRRFNPSEKALFKKLVDVGKSEEEALEILLTYIRALAPYGTEVAVEKA